MMFVLLQRGATLTLIDPANSVDVGDFSSEEGDPPFIQDLSCARAHAAARWDEGCYDLAYFRGAFAWIRCLCDPYVCPPWFRYSDYFARVATLTHARVHHRATDNPHEFESPYAMLSPADAMDHGESCAAAAWQIYRGGSYGPGRAMLNRSNPACDERPGYCRPRWSRP